MDLAPERGNVVEKKDGIYTWFTTRYKILKLAPDGPAHRAGLTEDWGILQVDGSTFEWQAPALLYYATRRPSVEVLAQKRSGWSKGKEKRFILQLQEQTEPTDPGGAEIQDTTNLEHVLRAVGPQLAQAEPWRALARLRAGTLRFAPIPVALQGRTWWVIRGDPAIPDLHAIGLDDHRHPRWLIREKVPLVLGVAENQNRVFLEFWKENPAGETPEAAPAFLCPEPTDHILKGRILRLQDHWFRVGEVALQPADGRLTRLEIQPWEPDINSLQAGVLAGPDLGPGASLADWSSLERLANENLLSWKVRKLASTLASESADGAEELVLRLEKGLLNLDLATRKIRAGLDAAAREQTERKAMAELAAQQGRPIPRFQPFPTAEMEQIADLLDQRKAILMAVLGSAKQALANLRR